jgi:serine protease Do
MARKVLLSVVILLGWWPSLGLAGDRDLTPREIYERDSSAVVLIIGYSNSGQRGSGGTGSIIQEDGVVLTNAHVVIEEQTGKPYPRLSIYLKPDRLSGDPKTDLSRSAKGRVLAFSQPLDLALLKIDGPPGPFPVLELDDSDRIAIGDRVVAIGHPEQGGLWTLTTGTISAEFENFNATTGKSVFQTETGLNRGNSGGPLLDTYGHMVGVNTAIARLSADGLPITSISFSVKSNVVKRWLRDQGLGHQGQEPHSVKSEPASPVSPTASASPPLAASSRPYNLDRLISERSRAEADLEDMIKEMRGKFRGQ